MPSGALTRDLLVFGNGDKHAYGVDARTGRQRWQTPLRGVVTMASTTVVAGNVAVSSCSLTVPNHCATELLDARTGRPLWIAPFGDSDASPTFANGTVFVSGFRFVGDPSRHEALGTLTALDARNGNVRWAYRSALHGPLSEAGSGERAIAGTYADGTLYQSFPMSDELIAFDGRSGHPRWKFRSLAPVKMRPIIRAGKLYVGDNSGVLYIIDVRSGTSIATISMKAPFTTSPPFIVGRTLIYANDSTLIARPLDDRVRARPRRDRTDVVAVRAIGDDVDRRL